MIPEEQHAEVLNTVWLTPQATYSKGGSFGEKAINNESQARNGTAVCVTDCKMATLNKVQYQSLVDEHFKNQKLAKIAFLKKLPMFAHWYKKPLDKLIESIMEQNYIRNQNVYLEDEKAQNVYLITQGEFLLTKRVPVKEEYQVQLDKLIGPN